MTKHSSIGFTFVAAISLAACGGGGGGGSNVEPTPAPPPPPPPPPLSVKIPFGVSEDTTFATVGDTVEFRWDADAKAYEIKFVSDQFVPLTLGDANANSENHYPPSSLYGFNLRKDLDFQYSNLAVIFENGWGTIQGHFAYGIPTAPSDVPVSGTASYSADVYGQTGNGSSGWIDVTGSANLNFDFAGGTLSGHFDPVLNSGNGTSASLGRYSFTSTVFGVGSTSFSGSLQHDTLNLSGAFNGLFTGPKAAELLAQWNATYRDPTTQSEGTMKGVWIGKKGP